MTKRISGIFAQIKLSDEYIQIVYIKKIKVRYQCQFILKITEYSNPTGQEKFGLMSQAAYITDTSQLMQSRD